MEKEFVESEVGRYVISNLSKGGVLKVFDCRGPIASDTGLIGELDDGRVIVTHLIQSDNKISGSISGEEGANGKLKETFV